MLLTKTIRGEKMIGSSVEINDSIYLRIPIAIEAINQNKYEMLQYNNIKGIIDFNRQYLNDICYLTYSLNTYVSLKTLEKQEGLHDTQLIEVLSQINEIIYSLEDYFLLESRDLVITLENIYYDFHKNEVHLLYLPSNEQTSFLTKYQLFLRDLIAGMTLERKHSSFINALQQLIKKDKFSIQGLNDLIKNQVLGCSKEESNEMLADDDLFFKRSDSLADLESSKSVENNSKVEVIKDFVRGVAIEVIGLLSMNLVIKFFEVSETNSLLGIVLSIQFLTFATIYFVVLKEYYGYEKIKEYFNSKGDYQKKTSKESNIFASNDTTLKNTVKEEIVYNTSTVIQGMIEDEYQPKAYLIKRDQTSEEKIYIRDKNFIIGRQMETTNYRINDSKISKRHLEVLDIDEELFIRDLNSTNGTYLNDEKLDPNRLTKIFNGDLIKMASLVYEFKIE
jgi:hypothetical protein